ncbi:MAG: ATP-grasp domain-containing protein [Deltaproteobacteria bacterium]|nr:ATP-grasp domain-containing protein [Deltaproteobacteria bacterium]
MFRKILIANRGEVACRIIKTCRRLGVGSVAVHSDADATALHVRAADEAASIGPPPVQQSYLNVEAILAAARRCGAEAIHPGYGLLSENAAFARAVREAGLVFIGPPAEALEAFGDKIRAREVASSVDVLPPPGRPIPLDDAAFAASAASSLGFPLLVKAAGGGGGIGMQVVRDGLQLERAVRSCSDRARSAFSDARVYVEKLIDAPRHIEVQVLCDAQGGAAALGDRECSAQRRHQKIVEESPSPASFLQGPEGEARRAKLHESALRVVRAAGYVNAGTVEFVADASGDLWFLEVNARLQVEHPVTEMVGGVDLVELQLRIAAGEPAASDLSWNPRGHSIETRLYAEDPAKMFAPQPGRITALQWPAPDPHVRVETGVEQGSELTPYYDPMIAKLVVWGEDRAAALRRLRGALDATVIELQGPRGPAVTNLEFLRQLVRSEAFESGQYDTGLVSRVTGKAC